MRLDRLRLKNFCYHRELDWVFSDGITSISGENGSGKSSALTAIYAALTGDFKRNDGVMGDNINQFCSEKEESFVELHFSTDSSYAVITRYLRPNKRSLVIDGGTPITSDKEISTAIEGLIGVSFEILSDYVFVRQGDMLGAITMRKGDRLSALQSLYGLQRSETCYDEISKSSAKIIVQTPSETIESIAAQLREKNLILNSLKESIVELNKQELDDSNLKSELGLIRKQDSLNTSIAEANVSLFKVSKELNDLNVKRPSLVDKLSELNVGNFDAMLSDYKRAKTAWRAISEYDLRMASNIDAERLLSGRLRALIDSKPEKLKGYIASSGKDFNHLTELCGTLSAKQDCLHKLQTKNECPVCGSTGSTLAVAVDALKETISILEPTIKLMRELYQLSRDYDTQISDYETNYSLLNNQIALLKSRMEEVRPEEPTVSESEADKFIATFNEIRINYNAASSELAKLDSSIVSAEASIATLTALIDSKKHLCDTSIDYAKIDRELSLKIAEIAVNKENSIRFQEQERSLKESIVYLESRREKIMGDISEAHVNKEIKDHLENLKTVMHKTNLPRKLTVNYLKRTVVKANNYLEDFSAPFRIYSDDDLVFWAKFIDGRDLPVGRLSGGELGVLSLAFRLAVHFEIGAGLNLLVLDEPTDALDEANLECIETAFSRMRAMSKSCGLQVLIVSHRKAIERMCDHKLLCTKR